MASALFVSTALSHQETPVVERSRNTGVLNIKDKVMKGYMYILECANGNYYTGSTIDLERRLAQHQTGEGANFTKKHLPIKLVYFEEYPRIDQAFYREKQIQGWNRKKKEALINSQLDELKELAECKNESHWLRLRSFRLRSTNEIPAVASTALSHQKTGRGFDCAQPPETPVIAKNSKITKKISSVDPLIRLLYITAMRQVKMKVNRKYKDSVFRSIFNNKPAILELYNAIEGTNYRDESIIEINTLKDVLFAAIQNDLSFGINKKMVILIEHQSTINENMPVRFLAYILNIYLNVLGERLYSAPLVKLPRPEFIVLYNGEAPFPKEKFYRLSDAFEEIDEETKNSKLLFLDVLVRVYNINKGRSLGLERKSKTLKGYATFIAKVREYAKTKPLEKAIKLAVEYCLKKGILADYFKENVQEVVKMIKLEYSFKDELKFARKEGIEEGLKEGQNYVLELMAQGWSYEEIKKKIEKTSKKNTRGKN